MTTAKPRPLLAPGETRAYPVLPLRDIVVFPNVKLNKRVPPEAVGIVQQIEDYAKLADTVASHLALKIPDRQAILETTVVTERLEKVLGLIDSEISVLQVEKRIRARVKRQMEKSQREYFLNE